MALHFGGKCSRLELCNPDQDFSWAQESGEELRPFNFFNKHALNVKLWKTHLVVENYFLKSYCTSILRPSLVIRTDDFQISFSLIFSSKLVNVNQPRTLKSRFNLLVKMARVPLCNFGPSICAWWRKLWPSRFLPIYSILLYMWKRRETFLLWDILPI
jgi:hypothetical protein